VSQSASRDAAEAAKTADWWRIVRISELIAVRERERERERERKRRVY